MARRSDLAFLISAFGLALLSACSVEDRAKRLAVDWVEEAGESCGGAELDFVKTDYFTDRGVGSVSHWKLKCSGGSNHIITIVRKKRTIEEFEEGSALRKMLEEGIEDGETLADGVFVNIPFSGFQRMYGGDWPLGDFPPVAPEKAD